MNKTHRRPNIVLINCDDLGYGDLGCYGSSVHDTPALDRLAAEGARFTDFYAASPLCSPSRAAMLTGAYPTRIGFGRAESGPLRGVLMPGWTVGLNPDETTLARLLKAHGYATRLVGKWHCGDQPDFLPTAHGFDGYYGLPYSNDMGRQALPEGEEDIYERANARARALGWHEPIDFPPLPLMRDLDVIEQQPDQASLTLRYLEDAIRFIRGNRSQPFFLYFAHMYVHLPLYVQERFSAVSRNGDYGAAVSAIDWVTEALMFELRRLGIDEDTIVVFTSDNGALSREQGGSGYNTPLRGGKGSTWEGGQRVPCILRYPARVPAGQVVSDVVSALDLYPTLASLCHVDVSTQVDGTDISALIGIERSRPDADRPFFYILGPNIEAVRVGRWKLHVLRQHWWGGVDRVEEVEELYDLIDDPGETTNVATEHPEIVNRLSDLIAQGRSDLGDERLGIAGGGIRPMGKVETAAPLTTYDPEHPYFQAEYDLLDRG